MADELVDGSVTKKKLEEENIYLYRRRGEAGDFERGEEERGGTLWAFDFLWLVFVLRCITWSLCIHFTRSCRRLLLVLLIMCWWVFNGVYKREEKILIKRKIFFPPPSLFLIQSYLEMLD